jgi:hypothetical protein
MDKQTPSQEPPSLHEAGERVRADLGVLRDAVERPVTELRDAAYSFVDEHPLAAMGAAFGVGFLLAGGLYSKTTGRVLKFGTRFLLGKMLKQALAGAGVGFLMAEGDGEAGQ